MVQRSLQIVQMTYSVQAPVPRLDRLSALLEGLAPEVTVCRFPLDADSALGSEPAKLWLYLLTRGGAALEVGVRQQRLLSPALVICRSDAPHRLEFNHEGAPPGIVRVEARLRGPVGSLLLDAFRAPCTVALGDADSSLLHAVNLIAAELEQPRCGQPALLHRAGDILFIGVLRQLVARPSSEVGGLLSGLADQRLARALVAMHARPQAAWTLERLAEEAGMSRTAFARHFHDVMLMPPGRYVQVVRLAIARSTVAAGRGLKQAALAAGYQNTSALSRALSREAGAASRQ